MLLLLALTGDDLFGAIFNIADGDVAGLIGAITTSNSNGQSDTINLAANGTYTLFVVNNMTLGPNGLPVIGNEVAGLDLTINGNGAVIQRSTAGGTPDFRLLHIGSGAQVTVNSLRIVSGRVSGSTFPDQNGGGIFNNHGNLTLNGCTLSSNHVSNGSGGGVMNYGFPAGDATLVVQNSTLNNNFVSMGGGAIQNYSGSLTLSNSTLLSNVASPNGSGGAISDIGGSATVTNCTFSTNSASTGVGGAIYNQVCALTVRNCTMSNNSADQGGMCIWNTAPSSGNAALTLSNTILQKGAAATNVNLKNFQNGTGTATITSQGYNLSSDNGGGFLIGTGDQINTDPKLASSAPQNNGGATATLALQPGSPAIDKGKDVGGSGQDQRGQARGFDDPAITPASGGDNSDIGAFEARDVAQSGNNLAVNTTDDHRDGVCGTTDCSLRDAIDAANGVAGAQTIAFSNTVTGTITLQAALGELAVTGDTTISGPGARSLAVSGNIAVRIFDFMSGTSTVSGLTLRNGAVYSAPASFAFAGAILNFTTLTLNDCALTSNSALGADNFSPGGVGGNGDGGAIENRATLTVNRCTFDGNTADGGLGGDNTGVTTGGNGGYGKGGAIFNAGTLSITNSTFSNNSAFGEAGGNSNFGGNGGDGLGGAIANQGTLGLTSCTFGGNTAARGAAGHGVVIANDGVPGAGRGGAIATIGGASETLSNTIAAANSCGSGGGLDVDGAFTSGGYNLIGSADHSTGFTAMGDQTGTDAAPLDAKLGGLQANGGETDTMSLLSGSPALENGKSFGLTTDQRGSLRPIDDPALGNASGGDGSDIGAYEKDVTQSGSVYEVNTIADHTGTCTLGDCTLREAIAVTNAHAGADAINFKAGLAGTILLQNALGQLSVTDATTISGPGARLITVSGHFSARIFSFSGGSSLVAGLTIRSGGIISTNPATIASGGGILNQTTLVLNDCTLRDNVIIGADTNTTGATGGGAQGGGIFNNGSLTLNRCTVRGNTAAAGHGGPDTLFGNTGGTGGTTSGGGIYNATGHDVTLNNCTFFDNTATGGAGAAGYIGGNGGPASGGAVSNLGTLTVTAGTISGNTSTGGAAGGGTFRPGRGGNSNGGGLETSAGSVTVRDSIVAGNTGTIADAKGTFVSGGYNLIGKSDGSTGFTAAGDQAGTNALPLDPILGVLQNNGGPTDTMLLSNGSPALDQGMAFGLSTDQRSSTRPIDTIFLNATGGDGSDIGAVEMNLLGGPDSDGDGMSDDYEFYFGLDDPLADADGDGLTNGDEFRAGTNPLDAASALRILAVLRSGNDLQVSFGIAVIGRTYRLERKDALTDANWNPINGVGDLSPSAIGNAEITDPGGATISRHFYHLRVLP